MKGKGLSDSGKVLTIFLAIIFILMLSLTGISLFFFQKEVEIRKMAEANLDQAKLVEAKMQADLKETKKQMFILEEKSKEADEKIDNLEDELELAKGIQEEVKKQNKVLQESLDNETREKTALREQYELKASNADKKIAQLESQLKEETQKSASLEKRTQELEKLRSELEGKLKIAQGGLTAAPGMVPMQDTSDSGKQEVQLDKIVVSPGQSSTEGRILTVDAETEFIIFNLGEKDGIAEGDVMSVYRGNQYLGDVKVSRVQPEMSAADFIPPLTSQSVSKNDRVIPKT